MQSLLLKNARDIQIDPVKREESRRKIKEAVYYERTLYTKNEFFRLVWMKADNILGSNLYKRLTPENEPRTLKNLVKRIRDQYDYDDYDSPHKIFEALNRELSTLQEVPYEDYVYGTDTSMNKKWFTGSIPSPKWTVLHKSIKLRKVIQWSFQWVGGAEDYLYPHPV